MNIYDRIIIIANEKGVSIYKLERDLGLSNGTISKWNKSIPGSVNLVKVANYLGTTVEKLINEEVAKKEKNY